MSDLTQEVRQELLENIRQQRPARRTRRSCFDLRKRGPGWSGRATPHGGGAAQSS